MTPSITSLGIGWVARPPRLEGRKRAHVVAAPQEHELLDPPRLDVRSDEGVEVLLASGSQVDHLHHLGVAGGVELRDLGVKIICCGWSRRRRRRRAQRCCGCASRTRRRLDLILDLHGVINFFNVDCRPRRHRLHLHYRQTPVQRRLQLLVLGNEGFHSRVQRRVPHGHLVGSGLSRIIKKNKIFRVLKRYDRVLDRV